ncbi:chaperone protein dnaJ C76, chloroplastic-like [Actinidia eriantha]|uniref:chaperone protein dnaJ C76, chloroplastic-like n=1 Tax=Actinidia eriantha TaxID=165200 RepID=UPI00258A81A0|nr:chaperone protein dnaJ C76, chloroplastic-like [Actinidia eriantha]
MLGSVVSIHQFPHIPTSRCWRQKSTIIRCCVRAEERLRTKKKKKNYYELLGVCVDSTNQEIKEAYRKLQKKYHPDIAGKKGHEYTLMLNQAYKVLMREDMRRDYDASIGQLRVSFGPDLGHSSWKGPFRPQALFVDENACIGCRECVHHASNTFMMDEALGCARVRVQYGDDDTKLEVSVESCPVNCIHWVDREELPVLELLIRPQPKQGHGIFGQGWERPKNVFMAAKAFHKQLKQEATHHQSNAQETVEKETPAQAEARENASMKLKMEKSSGIWKWVHEILGQ